MKKGKFGLLLVSKAASRGIGLLVLAFAFGQASLSQPPLPFHTVCPQGPPACDYASIQEAVQAANPGDILWIYPGTYQELITIDKSLQLVASQKGKVIVQRVKKGWGAAIILQTEDEITVVLDGLTVAVLPEACEDPKRGFCPVGIALAGEGAVTLVLNEVEASSPSAGLSCSSSGRVELVLNRVRLAASGSGLLWGPTCSAASTVEVRVSTFSGNIQGITLGPRSRSPWSFLVSNTRFIGNRGAGVYLLVEEANLTLQIEGSEFLGNLNGLFADFFKGGVYAEIRQSLFQANDYGIRFGFTGSLGLGHQDILTRLVDSQVSKNRVIGVAISSPKGTKGMELIRNEIRDNGTGVRIYGTGGRVALYTNSIEHNQLWGVALSIYRGECSQKEVFGLVGGEDPELEGADNIIRNNKKGDLCPEDYNWPEGFVKPPETP